MNREVRSYAEINAPIESVSIGLNGLLNLDDDLKRVKTVYQLDCKKDGLYAKSNEKQTLSYIYKMIRTIRLSLTSLSANSTRVDYVLTYPGAGGSEVVVVVLGVLFLVLALSGVFALLASGDDLSALCCGMIFGGMALLYFILLLHMVRAKKEVKMNEKFRQLFMERLIEYVKIAYQYNTKA